jgi:hypothetical protein
MIRIGRHIPPFEAIKATLPVGSAGCEPQRAPNGSYNVWLDARTVSNLDVLRPHGEDYSAAINRRSQWRQAGGRRPPRQRTGSISSRRNVHERSYRWTTTSQISVLKQLKSDR